MRATDGGKSPGPPQQQNRKLWDRLIATVVAENTQPAPSQDAARKLIKYLSNPQTVDIGNSPPPSHSTIRRQSFSFYSLMNTCAEILSKHASIFPLWGLVQSSHLFFLQL